MGAVPMIPGRPAQKEQMVSDLNRRVLRLTRDTTSFCPSPPWWAALITSPPSYPSPTSTYSLSPRSVAGARLTLRTR
eukprot:scaffold128539_cov31-Tisochrysis_lutea.AAC.6